ncbi:Osmotin, thaumatin-like protein [Basidiobolus meristosporus CBS 931.73]|uniref:Osmotin, thaumatin-like protein n=1 Tax=Basidiobolus meristosporus CBS 931.73 TaxID=1314790 RepID=A0A1Y1YN92_9FUNG|nr:Osmotin, thaumatin-like protein [Basidiobolus meristosporus CBS 931.73]|eukprot:ORX99472.1 Osmotin, thaumatin-like protein [Basidiobolus meristosporus CBS 931.73]
MVYFSQIVAYLLASAYTVSLAPVELAETAPGSHAITFVNRCTHNIWLAALTTTSEPSLPANGGLLPAGNSHVLSVEAGWQGRFWGRTDCNFGAKNTTSNTACLTGDCGSGQEYCGKATGQPPASLAEFKFNGHSNLDFYDISLVDGYNLPITIQPHSKSENGTAYTCTSPSIKNDINLVCPPELQKKDSTGRVIGCNSGCVALGTPELCCSGAHSTPQTCGPSSYSKIFKDACPDCYSYAYDDSSSTFTCSGDYTIQFC